MPLTASFYQLLTAGSGPSGLKNDAAHPRGVDVRKGGIYINGPGTLRLHARGSTPPARAAEVTHRPYADIDLRMPVGGMDRAATVAVRLGWVSGEEPGPEYDRKIKRTLGIWRSSYER